MHCRGSGRSVKASRTNRPKARKAPIKHAPPASLRDKLDQLTRELGEASQRETATSEVLQVISSSPGELESVFDAMLANATRICEAKFGTLYLRDGDGFSAVAATRDAPPAYFEARKQAGVSPDGPIRRAATTKQVAHVTDIKEQQSYLDRHPSTVASVELGKFRTVLGVPMLKDDELIGVITLNRQEVRPFTNKQIELVQNFAAQAVIAIENARLLNELRQRTDDLSESLQQQTATGEILTSISGSMTDAKPVFDAIVRNLLRLLGTRYAVVNLLQDGIIRLPAVDGEPGFEKLIDYYPRPLDGTTMGGLAMLSKQIVQFSPIIGNPAAPPATQKFASEFGFNSSIFAPMVRGDKVFGAIGVAQREPRPFDDKQIALITSFANQAVIAIENARLFDELQKRTDDLSESLQQQTATADVLKVISRSTFDLQVVLDTLLTSAIRLCGTDRGMIFRYDGDSCRAVAAHNLPREFLELWERTPIRAGRGTTVGRALLECRPVQIVDVKADPEYAFDEAQKMFAFRTVLAVPMLREGIPKGVIGLIKTEVEPFTDKQIALVETFADQAAIAIENVRLFDEIQDKNQQLAEASQNKSQFLSSM